MKLFLYIALTALPVFAISNLNVTVQYRNGGFAVNEQMIRSGGGGYSVSDTVWIAANATTLTEDGTMAYPYHNITQGVITQSYGKMIFLMPGTYSLSTNITVGNGSVRISGFSRNPNDVLITQNHSTTSSALFVLSAAFQNDQSNVFSLDNVTLTTTNISAGGVVFYRSVVYNAVSSILPDSTNFSVFIKNATLNNCIIKNCSLIRNSNNGIVYGFTLNDCKLINNSSISNYNFSTPFVRGCIMNRCLVNNNAVIRKGSSSSCYIIDYSDINDCIIESCILSNTAATSSSSGRIANQCNVKNSIFRNNLVYFNTLYSCTLFASEVYRTKTPMDNVLIQNSNVTGTGQTNSCAIISSSAANKVCALNSGPIFLYNHDSKAYLCGLRFFDAYIQETWNPGVPVATSNAVYGAVTNTAFCNERGYF